jgi:hypothetical protein
MGKAMQPHNTKSQPPSAPEYSPYAFSYLELRRAIGLLAISLPMILYFGAQFLFQTGLLVCIALIGLYGIGDPSRPAVARADASHSIESDTSTP